ncbi:MAG: hypothetical protein JW913_13285 [Chitinispirillaceae bacterium]|nr:hypothetical protein [Chitinispirillaceae bacterium]
MTGLNKITIIIAMVFAGACCIKADDPYALDEAYADAHEYSVDEIKTKVRKYSVMRAIGISGISLGGASLITGICLSSTADIRTFEETKAARAVNPDTVFDESGDIQMITGIMSMLVSLPIGATGAVLTGIGSKKRKEYRMKLRIRGARIHFDDKIKSIRISFAF